MDGILSDQHKGKLSPKPLGNGIQNITHNASNSNIFSCNDPNSMTWKLKSHCIWYNAIQEYGNVWKIFKHKSLYILNTHTHVLLNI